MEKSRSNKNVNKKSARKNINRRHRKFSSSLFLSSLFRSLKLVFKKMKTERKTAPLLTFEIYTFACLVCNMKNDYHIVFIQLLFFILLMMKKLKSISPP